MSEPELERIAQTLKEIPFPSRFAVEVNADCNLNCTMCHHDQMVRPKGRMPLPLWKKLADEIAEVSPRTQCWFSFCGEPLLETELLLEMLAYGNSVGLKSMNVNTNGMLLTNETADALLNAHLDRIVIGLDGFSKEAYESIRCGGDRDVVYGYVEYLVAQQQKMTGTRPEVNVQFIEMDENEGELEVFVDYWLAKGATVKARNKLSWGGRFGTPMDVSIEDRIPCPWAMTMMHVFWDGRVPRCPGDTEGDEGVGNAWDESLSALWNELGAYRGLHMRREFEKLPDRCQECKDWMTGAADRIRVGAPQTSDGV